MNGTKITEFEDILTNYASEGTISSNTEDAFWQHVGENKSGYINYIISRIRIMIASFILIRNILKYYKYIYFKGSRFSLINGHATPTLFKWRIKNEECRMIDGTPKGVPLILFIF